MKRILTAAALTAFAATGGLAAAGSAAADTGGMNLPSVVPLSGVLNPKPLPPAAADMPAPNKAVEKLLPGRH
ncbi:hypothetical protein HHL19_34125 [Streptomyces sp. R302]|uniref:hypothetical protein n=1 Tax=unclassified Streptomyces TaxID=2593676 RepID=UPI00145C8904|nr:MULTISPECIES: hypothetical protein [unclassified Streptomyces]NML54862.1 hypothetical protein [Streptomyces sp. R301]NML83549.1 hypothetical protein [Streptomyces sp. R302]